MNKRNHKATQTLLLMLVVAAAIMCGCNDHDGKKNNGKGDDSAGIQGAWSDNPKFSPPVPTTVTFGSGTNCAARGMCTVAGGKGNASFNMPANQFFIYCSPTAIPASSIINNTYTFDAPYSVDKANPALSSCSFPIGTIIPPQVAFPITTSLLNPTLDSMALTTVQTSYDSMYVQFGGYSYGGVNGQTPNPVLPGISATSNTPQQGYQKVYFYFQPGNAQNVVLTFDTSTLRASQPQAMNNFYQSGTSNLVSSYIFSDSMALYVSPSPYNLRCLQYLPAGAAIMPSSTSKVGVNTMPGFKTWITDTITYGYYYAPLQDWWVNVQQPGSLLVNWQNNAFAPNPVSYTVSYSANQSGPYTQACAALQPSVNSCTINNLKANQLVFFFVTSVYAPTEMVYTDTLCLQYPASGSTVKVTCHGKEVKQKKKK